MRNPTSFAVAVCAILLSGCEEAAPTQPTQAQCDQRCEFFLDLNTELGCERAVTAEDCDSQCLEEDPCLTETLAFNACRYQQPAEDYICDTAGLGYPQLTGDACQTEFSAAIDCASENF